MKIETTLLLIKPSNKLLLLSIWDDLCIPMLDWKKLWGPRPNTELKFIKDLVDQDTGTWDLDKIITQVRVLQTIEGDMITWTLEKNGLFAVKSAYNIFCENRGTPLHLSKRLRNLVWKTQLLHRIKLFLCKCVTNALHRCQQMRHCTLGMPLPLTNAQDVTARLRLLFISMNDSWELNPVTLFNQACSSLIVIPTPLLAQIEISRDLLHNNVKFVLTDGARNMNSTGIGFCIAPWADKVIVVTGYRNLFAESMQLRRSRGKSSSLGHIRGCKEIFGGVLRVLVSYG